MGSKEQVFKTFVREGDTFAKKGDWEKAITSYLKALEINENAKDVHEKLLKVYLSKGDKKGYTEALSRFNAVRTGSPIVKNSTASQNEAQAASPSLSSLDSLQVQKLALPQKNARQEIGTLFQPEEVANTAQDPPLNLEEVKVSQMEEIKTSQKVLQEAPHKELQETLQKTHQKALQEEIMLPDKDDKDMEALKAEKPLKNEKLHEREAEKPYKDKAFQYVPIVETKVETKKDNLNLKEEALALEETYTNDPANIDILSRLSQLYSMGVSLKGPTVEAIYKKIYRMRI